MLLTRRELPILLFTLVYIPVFTIVAFRRANYEFLLYVAVILILGGVVVAKQHAIKFPPVILWGLSIWGLVHMAGGLIRVGDSVLYGLILVPLVPKLNILRFDQVVHFFGFGVATLICHHLLKRYVRDDVRKRPAYWLLIIMMGCGVGAMNEIVEFIAVLTMPQTGVGGYENTMLDLVFNFFGATAATLWLAWREHAAIRTKGGPADF